MLVSAVFAILVFFVFVLWSPPLFYNTVAEWTNSWQKNLFSFVCHQQLDRTLFLEGRPLAACSRCTGIYTGMLLGLTGWVLWNVFVKCRPIKGARIFFVISLVLLLDGFANFLDIWQSSNNTRVLIGLFWGLATGVLLANTLRATDK